MDTWKNLGMALAVLTIAGCASTQTNTASSETYEGLVPVRDTRMDEAWVRPDFDPTTYSKIMFRGAGIVFRPVEPASRIRIGRNTQFPISDTNKQRLEDVVTEEFRKELTQVQGYEVVDESGPDTLLLVVGLRDVVSHVPQELVGRHEIYLAEVGTATLVLEFRDSESGTTLVRGVDRRAAERYGQEFQRSSPVTNWPVVKRLAATWARGLRRGIDDMKTASNGR